MTTANDRSKVCMEAIMSTFIFLAVFAVIVIGSRFGVCQYRLRRVWRIYGKTTPTRYIKFDKGHVIHISSDCKCIIWGKNSKYYLYTQVYDVRRNHFDEVVEYASLDDVIVAVREYSIPYMRKAFPEAYNKMIE